MLVTVAGALAAPSFTSRIADRYIAPADEAVQTRVYVLAGGSNMDGRANAAELTAVNLERIQNASMRVQLVYVGGFDPTRVKSPASRYEGPLATVSPVQMLKQKFRLSRSFGPELFFGAALAEAHPTGRFELIKHGFGGSTLVNASWSNKVPVAEPTNSAQAWEGVVAWSPGDWRFRATKLKASWPSDPDQFHKSTSTRPGVLYECLVTDVLQRLRDDKAAVLSGVLWVHGEMECHNPETARAYPDALAEIVRGMRSDLRAPELPFAMLMPWPRGAHLAPALPEFLSGLRALERDLPHFQLVRATDASPLEVYGDRYSSLAASPFDASDVLTHYTEAGQRAAGELLARHVPYLS